MDNNILNNQLDALNNSLNYYKLNGYTIHKYKYYPEDKRKVKQLYFLTDSKDTSLTGHLDYAELSSFIRGYGEARNNYDSLLEALKMVVDYRTTSKHDSNGYRKKFMEATEKAKEAIKKAEQ